MLTVTQLTAELVRINSVSPKSKSHVGESDEKAIARWLSEYFTANHWSVELQPVVNDRPNLIARCPDFDLHRPTLALEAHMDTVDVQGMTVPPFDAVMRDGCIWGRGSCDVKGTLAVMITAAIEWCEQHPQRNSNIMVIASMGEEMGTLGAQAFTQLGLPLKAVLIGEPTNLQPVISHKGLWRLAVETVGRACHSSRPEEGINAIERMHDVIALIRGKLQPEFEAHTGNTLSMTTLHSGAMINIIPDLCRLEIDARFLPPTDIESHWLSWNKLLPAPVRLEEMERKPAFSAVPNSQLLSLLSAALLKHGLTPAPQHERYYSDAGHFSQAGYDAVIWGAGYIRLAHTAAEHIPIAELETAVFILHTLFDEFSHEQNR
jgi:acetylornithine deacetylase/succinyl-diaminopimelate desuccinylase-like protein